jgi:hypothetical protein
MQHDPNVHLYQTSMSPQRALDMIQRRRLVTAESCAHKISITTRLTSEAMEKEEGKIPYLKLSINGSECGLQKGSAILETAKKRGRGEKE